jgi:hypothetical protein
MYEEWCDGHRNPVNSRVELKRSTGFISGRSKADQRPHPEPSTNGLNHGTLLIPALSFGIAAHQAMADERCVGVGEVHLGRGWIRVLLSPSTTPAHQHRRSLIVHRGRLHMFV